MSTEQKFLSRNPTGKRKCVPDLKKKIRSLQEFSSIFLIR